MFVKSGSHISTILPQEQVRRSRAPLVLSRILGVALAALLVLPLAEATQPAEAGKKFKTITRTFSSNGQISIPGAGTSGPANPYPSTIKVDEFKKFKQAKITDVNLVLRGFNHELPENVDVMLALGNRQAIVMGDAGDGTDAVNIDLTLDDQAAADLPEGADLVGGAFRPANLTGADPFPAPAPAPDGNVALSTFNGAAPDGQWQLFVHDDFNGSTGSISGGWQLEITAKVKNDKDDKKGKKGKKNN